MGKIENYHRRRQKVPVLALLIALAWLVMIAMIWHTATSFAPRIQEHDRKMDEMWSEIDRMNEDLTQLNELVEAMPAVVVIQDEPMTPLADPYLAPTTTPTAETSAELPEVDPELIRIVALECDGSYEGALGVATVIFNQMDAGHWGDTIKEVVSYPGNFTVYKSMKTPPITDTILQACTDATAGERAFPPEVMYFCTPGAYKRSPFFRTLVIHAEYAGTVWCKEG